MFHTIVQRGFSEVARSINIYFVDSFSLYPTVKEFPKLVNSWWSYCKNATARFLRHTYRTYWKSHTGCRSVPTSVTLNDPEWQNVIELCDMQRGASQTWCRTVTLEGSCDAVSVKSLQSSVAAVTYSYIRADCDWHRRLYRHFVVNKRIGSSTGN